MRHYPSDPKRDMYELRPYLFFILGAFALIYRNSAMTDRAFHISQFCGLILVLAAMKILAWRKDYRKSN
ncbi:MAG: hypothetical protein ACAH59_05510 [Pseudobdellovibrionaceae bacterium]